MKCGEKLGKRCDILSQMDYLDSLNTEQKKAVLCTDGPVLIVAGAGAGKTKTLAHRILHLIKNGVRPESILAITFTNKAAREMRERVFGLIQQEKNSPRKDLGDIGLTSGNFGVPFVSTFHSLGVLIIKENAHIFKLPRHFKIFDKADSKKAIKEAIMEIGLDPKEHLDKMQNIISAEKSRGVSVAEFLERGAFDFTSESVKKVWPIYEKILARSQALDFDDLLLKTLHLLSRNKEILEKYQNRFLYIHVDEFQDTNKVQNEIIELLARKHQNICIVGDTDQCLVTGTKIKMADGNLKPIENVKSGEFVLSNYGSGDFRSAKIVGKKSLQFKGELIRIETEKGKILESTPEHTHFAGYRLGLTPQMYLNYLMYKKNVGWRIGTTSVYTKSKVKSVVGFMQRSNQEHADAVWIIGTYKTQNEARVGEYILSLKYQIPTIPFTPRKGISYNGYVHDKTALEKIFSSFDTEKSAKRLLLDLGFFIEHPHHKPQSHNSNRRNINVVLCGDKRSKTPMHLISIFGNDPEGKEKLKSLGISIRPSKANTKNWRFETARADYGEVCLLATKIASLFPEVNIVFSARLGGQKENPKDGNSLPCIPAGSVMPGMALFTQDGYDIVSKISRIPKSKIKVFDLDVEKTHNFIANGILTHNCIYGWRGAEIKNMLHFEKTYPDTQTFFLEQNYRSTKNILAVADEIIQKNNFRIPKKLFTENKTGEKIGIFEARDETDEAQFIALRSKELIESGEKADEIAVLYRANFQSRVLEESFLAFGVPYQMLGTKFFERKEIKDTLAYISVALNPENRSDFLRAIGTPSRGIGKTTVQKILTGRENELPGSMQIKINNFRDLLSDFRKILQTEKPSVAVKKIIEKSGMEKMYETGLDEDTDRLENIMELVTLATRYDDLMPEEGIEKFLTESALASDQDSLDGGKNGVRLMTVHSSKGLEFNFVFISGLEADLFPHCGFGERKSGEEKEEERRLFYVALTRARQKLFLTHAETRTIFGKTEVNAPSEFLDDISAKYLEKENYGGVVDKEPIFKIDF
jgi:DNA helicase-2/ATP-dependent DNA helicase PcrA